MGNAIELDSVTQKYGDRIVLDKISFKVKTGQIHGLLGPNGAGKTTTMKLILNLLRPISGEIRVLGSTLGYTHPELPNKLGHLLEYSPLYEELKVKEYLIFLAKLRKVDPKQLIERVDYCLRVLDLTSVADRLIGNLSRGYRQRVGVAQAIIHMPAILILDEPTIGLDPQTVVEMRKLILNLKQNHTILLSSHHLHEMSLLCDEVTIIADGRILDSGPIEEMSARIGQSMEIDLGCLQENKSFEDFLQAEESVSHYKLLKEKNGVHYQIFPRGSQEIRPLIIKKAVDVGMDVTSFQLHQKTLEDIFIRMTEKHD